MAFLRDRAAADEALELERANLGDNLHVRMCVDSNRSDGVEARARATLTHAEHRVGSDSFR
jgi:hypothetical protein